MRKPGEVRIKYRVRADKVVMQSGDGRGSEGQASMVP
jgi:hypothetical protein